MTGPILLLGLGLLLIIAEVLIPSMGILGIAASACIVAAVAWAFNMGTGEGMRLLAAAALGVPAFVMLAVKLLPRSPLTRKLMARGFSFEDGAGIDRRDEGLLGQEGTVEAPLRPVGTARIAGRRVDVLSRGEAIEAGARVSVIEVKANRVLVARAESSLSNPSTSAGAVTEGGQVASGGSTPRTTSAGQPADGPSASADGEEIS